MEDIFFWERLPIYFWGREWMEKTERTERTERTGEDGSWMGEILVERTGAGWR